MRMDEMNKLFEDAGFEVERKWETEHNWYRFTIYRDGTYYTSTYTYPHGARPEVSSASQRMFVKRTIKEFERDFGPRRRIISYSLQKSFMAVLTDWCHRHRIIVNTEINAEDDKANLHFFKDGKEEHITIYWPEIISIMDVLAGIHERLTESGMVPDKYLTYTRRNDSLSAMVDLLSTKYVFANGKYFKTVKNTKLETSIKDVIFNPPATIVMWDDGTKTVVKAQGGDEFDAEKGLAMAISKKALGNDRKYYHTFIHWLKKYEKQNVTAEQEMKFDIKLTDMSAASANLHKLHQEIYENFGIPSAILGSVGETATGHYMANKKKHEAVQKTYDLLVKFRDTSDIVSVDEVIGYLGEALED